MGAYFSVGLSKNLLSMDKMAILLNGSIKNLKIDIFPIINFTKKIGLYAYCSFPKKSKQIRCK